MPYHTTRVSTSINHTSSNDDVSGLLERIDDLVSIHSKGQHITDELIDEIDRLSQSISKTTALLQLKIFFPFRWLWKYIGVRPEILSLVCCLEDQPKYTRAAALIMILNTIACFSVWYATAIMFDIVAAYIVAPIFLGFFWAFDTSVFSIKKEGQFWKDAKSVVPRLILSLILCIGIAIPLKLRSFQGEIMHKIDAIHLEEATKKADGEEKFKKMALLKKEYKKVEKEIENAKEILEGSKETIKSFSTKLRENFATVTKKQKRELAALITKANKDEQNYTDTKTANQEEMDSLQTNIEILDEERKTYIDDIVNDLNKTDNGLLARMIALSELAQEKHIVLWMAFGYVLVLLTIDLSILFLKIFTFPKSTFYEQLLEINRKHNQRIVNDPSFIRQVANKLPLK